MKRQFKLLILALALIFVTGPLWADEQSTPAAASTPDQQKLPLVNTYFDPLNYTLGPQDTIEVTVYRHPEFSGIFPVNEEGKIQFKFAGDIEVTGLTKKQLEEKITKAISSYLITPQVNVTILEYNSKVIYVLGEVGTPGKYIMKSDKITVREAVVNAGLPTLTAAMRKCRIITPDKGGEPKVKSVDLYSVLYGGNLKYNYEMHAGDVLYIPSTIMTKLIRVINPVTATVNGAVVGPDSANTGKTAVRNMAVK